MNKKVEEEEREVEVLRGVLLRGEPKLSPHIRGGILLPYPFCCCQP